MRGTQHGVTRDDWIVGGLGLLLLIVLLALPWWHRAPAASGAIVSESRPAVQAPYAWAAIIAVLALIALVVDLGMQRFLPDVKVPTLRDGRTMRLIYAVVAAVFLVLKFLLHPSNLGFGVIVALIVGVLLLYSALVVSRGASPLPGR
jgi:hypothetical protein